MSAENLKSSAITNATATPLVKTNSNVGGGFMKEAVGTIAPAAAAEAASTYRFCRVPSNCRISQLFISAADFTTAGVVDVGVYQTTENGGAVVDADFFATLLDLAASTGAGTHLDITNESGTYTLAKQEQMLWEALGLSADSNREYDIVATVTTAFNGGQTMTVKCRYVV